MKIGQFKRYIGDANIYCISVYVYTMAWVWFRSIAYWLRYNEFLINFEQLLNMNRGIS